MKALAAAPLRRKPRPPRRAARLRPAELGALLDSWLCRHADPAGGPEGAQLAAAIAAACLGRRHLWQDLRLPRREVLTALITHYFPQLAARNTQGLRWKHFLVAELGSELGMPELRPPGCHGCADYPHCFPDG